MTMTSQSRAALALFIAAMASATFGFPGVMCAEPGPLDPAGRMHVPIGVPNTLDSVKTFVEAEGCFSPGVGSYGIYFWVYDCQPRRLFAPTMKEVVCHHGWDGGRYLIPWAEWPAGDVTVRSEVCEVRHAAAGYVFLVGARVRLTNQTDEARRVLVYVALRPLGPAGFEVRRLAASGAGDALLADGHAAVVAASRPAAAGVLPTDSIGQFALRGEMPQSREAISPAGDCSGALRFDIVVPARGTETIRLLCPVLAGRRAVRHRWVARKTNYIDAAVPQSDAGGIDVPDLGLDAYRRICVDELFDQARAYWRQFYGRMKVELPDRRWTDGFYVMLAHAGLCMNEGAPDVAAVNYTVFNRDGVYVANMLQKAGRFDLSAAAIDYFLKRPFNGRPFPEADNPGQVLWCMGQHWAMSGDRAWLHRVWPQAREFAEMIGYYRTGDGPHWVSLQRLAFGSELPASERVELTPGRCDGFHPEYTEAFDIAGLRAAADLAEAAGRPDEAQRWRRFAQSLFDRYDQRCGKNLRAGYGSYAVLWPCRLYRLDHGPAHEQFRPLGKQPLSTWRYFAPATAHQSLLAGDREAGYGTVQLHLGHRQMQDWFAFDEGGRSCSGGWQHLRTTWPHSKSEPDANRAVAMPHGWAIAELWLLMRDCLAFEDGDRLVLLAGVDPRWLRDPAGIHVANLPTRFGPLSFRWLPTAGGGLVHVAGTAAPPGGFRLRLPPASAARIIFDRPTGSAAHGAAPQAQKRTTPPEP